MKQIRLPKGIFEYDPDKPLGKRGGFGQVFLGRTPTGEEVAIKKLHVSAKEAGHRELEIAAELQARSFQHVIPFIDEGEDADTGDYFLVMPKAESSLQVLIDKEGAQPLADTANIMLQIARGLLEVKDLVHRDLKPDNILRHTGKWKVADFGIARFVTKVTSSNTLKGCMSEHYAAPEQWRFERATTATDVYSLVCIGFCLLTGGPPFTRDPQREHQEAAVPDFSCVDNRLKGLIKDMLRKPPESRPSLSRVESVLAGILNNPISPVSTDAFSELAAAGAIEADQAQQAEAKLEADRKAREARARLVKAAVEILSENTERLWDEIHANVLAAERKHDALGLFQLSVGEAVLAINTGLVTSYEPGLFRHSKWDVVAGSLACVRQKTPQYMWIASLYYAKTEGGVDYRWYEVGFFTPFGQVRNEEPHAPGDVNEADMAIRNISSSLAVAYGPWPIDAEMEDEFHNRWVWLLARAAKHELGRPNPLPFKKWPPQME